jgi:flagellin
MGMQVNTNVAANNAYRNLATTQNDLSKSLEKLSSGLRINRAADDAAGLAISEGLKSQVGGLTVAARNAQDAVSVIQTAEGSLNEVQSILQRVRDLAVQAGNDSNNTESRGAIQTEVTALTAELTRIGQSTNFNGTQLLDGTRSDLSFQVGANGSASSQISVDLTKANVSAVVAEMSTGITEVLASDFAAGAQTAAEVKGSYAGAAALTWASSAADVVVDVGGASFSAAHGANAGELRANLETAAAAFSSAQTTAGNAISVTIGGSANDYTFAAEVPATTGNDAEKFVFSGGGSSTTSSTFVAGSAATYAADTQAVEGVEGFEALNFSDAGHAAKAIDFLDKQISAISTARASLGADQNRFESVIKNLAVSKENLTAAGSRIRDTDMAEEMVKYTRANILSQAGTAMLAQANQSNSGVLQLLQ